MLVRDLQQVLGQFTDKFNKGMGKVEGKVMLLCMLKFMLIQAMAGYLKYKKLKHMKIL